MAQPSARTYGFATRLLRAEAAFTSAQEAPNATTRVIQKLSVVLGRFAGQAGCDSIVARALALARNDTAMNGDSHGGWLHSVTLEPNCVFKGLPTSSGADDQQAILLIAHVLTLLNTFIGESMTVMLLREAWPGELFDLKTESRELP